jgi:hypothetical protein
VQTGPGTTLRQSSRCSVNGHVFGEYHLEMLRLSNLSESCSHWEKGRLRRRWLAISPYWQVRCAWGSLR